LYGDKQEKRGAFNSRRRHCGTIILPQVKIVAEAKGGGKARNRAAPQSRGKSWRMAGGKSKAREGTNQKDAAMGGRSRKNIGVIEWA